jgi:hypothetical protein
VSLWEIHKALARSQGDNAVWSETLDDEEF